MSVNKRVSFLASLTADPAWRQKAGLDGKPSTDNSRTESRPVASERGKLSSAGDSDIVRGRAKHDNVQRGHVAVSSTGSGEGDSQEATGVSRGSSVNTLAGHERLERINAQFGTVCAYDGRYCVWTTRDNGRTRDSFDVRDVAKRLGITMHDVVDSLPEFKPVRRGRASETPEDSTE